MAHSFMSVDELLVFDTGPLCHFAQENWLGLLKAVVGKRTAVIPNVVAEELRIGAAQDRRIHAVLDATWIELRELRTDEEITAFARFSELLVRGDRNWGRQESSPSLLHRAAWRSSMTAPPARRRSVIVSP